MEVGVSSPEVELAEVEHPRRMGGSKDGGPKGGGPKGGGPKFRAFFPLPTRGWSLRVCIIEKVVTTQIWSSPDIL